MYARPHAGMSRRFYAVVTVIFCMVYCLFAIGCTTTSTTPNAQALVTSLFEAFNLHDWEKMSGYYADDAEFLDPSLGKKYVKQSREATVAKYAELQRMFPDIRDDIEEVYAAGESIIVQFTSRGTMPDGTAFELPIVTVLTIRDGQIVRDATYYDLEIP
jgi:steroid delta-isomerase-like uncharacterized protein